MRSASVATLASLPLFMMGCFSADITVKLNPDGSGTIVQRLMVNSSLRVQMKTMMSGFAKQGGEPQIPAGSSKLIGLFDEGEARAQATKMGEGVSFVSSREVKTDTMEGRESVYAFNDIRQLKISEKPGSSTLQGMGTVQEGTSGKETVFRFQKLESGHALLTIVSPIAQHNERSETVAEPKSKPGAPSPEQLEQARRMFEGMRFSLVIDVQGSVIHTNSPYLDGSRVTILEMDFSQLLSNENLLKEMSSMKSDSLEDARNFLKNVKGFRVNLEPEVQVEFR